MRFSTSPIDVLRALAVASVALCLLAAATASGPVMAQPTSLSGVYDGGQMEIAAALELKPDGRFNYALSYGALDEQAEGRWTVSGDRVLLSSNPVVAPRLFLVSRSRAPEGLLQLSLDVPRGVSRQYFDALITRGNGQTQKVQLREDGLSLSFGRADPPTAVQLVLQMFRVASEPVRLDPSSGYLVQFRFEPNDIGKADFRAEPLRIVNGALVLERHGRTLRFRRRRQ
jgi:hypothetical protein